MSDLNDYTHEDLLNTMKLIARGSTIKQPGMSVGSRPMSKSELQMLAIKCLDRIGANNG